MRKWLTILLALVALAQAAVAKDVEAISGNEITNLQRRLTDAKCYTGKIDGKRSKALDKAIKDCPDQQPILRIETGMHTAPIRSFGVDAACTVMTTGSDDKTVRLWSTPEGRLIETLHLPIGLGNSGKITATTVSPDGRYVAAGGWDAALEKTNRTGVYLYDRQSHVIHHLGAFEATIASLAFSGDGRRLAVGLGAGKGLRLIDVASGRSIATDLRYGGDIYGLVFGTDGSLWSSSFDGNIRRYDRSLKLQLKAKAPEGERPFRIALDPAGKLLAAGYEDKPAVSVLNAQTLKPVAKADVTGLSAGNLASVGWDTDGSAFFAGGSAREILNGRISIVVRRFAPDGKPIGVDLPVAGNAIFDLKYCGGRIAFAAADPAFGLIDRAGAVTTLQGPRTADMRDKLGNTFTIASNGRSLMRFGLGAGEYIPVLFDLPAATLADALQASAVLKPARIDGLDIKNWQNDEHPTLAGKLLPLKPDERSRSLAIRLDTTGFVLGSGWFIRAFDAKGKQRWAVPTLSEAWGVNLAQDGNLIVAAIGDGTIRWYRWSDGKELLAIFIERPTRKWVAWTPTGYYMASPGGEDLIGWQLNRGWEQLADFYPASRFRDRFARPDIVQKILVTLDEDEAVKQANTEAKRKDSAKPIAEELPPVVSIAAPKSGDSFSDSTVNIDYAIRSPSGLKVTGLDVLIDGRPADGQRGLGRADAEQLAACPAFGSRDPGQAETDAPCHLTLPLPARDVDVALIARAGDKASEPAKVRLIYAGKPPEPEAILKPKLYVLAIGVSKYADPDLQLGLPAKDAHDFADAFQHQEGGLYGKVTVKLLTDRDATRDTVIEGFEWLEKQVTSRDIGIVFVAGQGTIDTSGAFWFLPVDATKEKLRTRGISTEDIRGSLARLAGKAVLFLDVCRATVMSPEKTRGLVDINGTVSEFSASENGVVVFGASTGRELSLENKVWGNGAFTKAIVEGIGAGKADLLHKGAITLSELDAYVADRVKNLTDGRQHPVMNKPGTVPDFPIGTAR